MKTFVSTDVRVEFVTVILTIENCLALLEVLVDVLLGESDNVGVEAHLASCVELGGLLRNQALLNVSAEIRVSIAQS